MNHDIFVLWWDLLLLEFGFVDVRLKKMSKTLFHSSILFYKTFVFNIMLLRINRVGKWLNLILFNNNLNRFTNVKDNWNYL